MHMNIMQIYHNLHVVLWKAAHEYKLVWKWIWIFAQHSCKGLPWSNNHVRGRILKVLLVTKECPDSSTIKKGLYDQQLNCRYMIGHLHMKKSKKYIKKIYSFVIIKIKKNLLKKIFWKPFTSRVRGGGVGDQSHNSQRLIYAKIRKLVISVVQNNHQTFPLYFSSACRGSRTPPATLVQSTARHRFHFCAKPAAPVFTSQCPPRSW